MKVGLQIADFAWPDGPGNLGPALVEIAQAADRCGFDSFSVGDHLFQTTWVGAVTDPMLECYTTLTFVAAHTSRLKLLPIVTAVSYRHPGMLAKIVSTLDVLSGGRAMLGIGAGWNEDEARGLGIPFPPLRDRFEMLEETLQICLQMWRGDEQPYEGRQYQLERPLNSPQSLQRPHPPILIGGSGEQKTLRLVARYADACNLYPTPDLPHKLTVLRDHCAAEGRDYDTIEKTCMMLALDVGENGSKTGEVIAGLRRLAGMGIQTVICSIKDTRNITPLEIVGREVIPAVADLE
jgi:F420-dependent oxidoreductase-like protein